MSTYKYRIQLSLLLFLSLFSVILIGCSSPQVEENEPVNNDTLQEPTTEVILTPTSPSPTPTTEKTMENPKERINTYLNSLEQAGFRGVVLVDKGGEVILSNGYGLANDDKGIPNTPQTIFDIGSISKQFTGAAILKLQDEGKLSVTDTLATYIPNLPEDKQTITLHQLLTHTAGIPEILGDDYEPIDRDTFIQRVIDTPLLHEPGSQHVYSNAGYSLLAIVIELVTDDSYELYLHDALFSPAGMEQTGYVLPDWEQAEIAVGYHGAEPWGKPNEKPWAEDGPYWHLRGNGGLLSSAEDMYLWHQALLTDKILSASAKEQYFAPHVPEGEGASSFYGYGWVIMPTPRETLLITHNGGNGIFFADFLRYVDEDVAIFIATNEADREFETVAENIARIIFNEDFVPVVRDESNEVEITISDLAKTPAGQTVELLLNTLQTDDEADITSLIENNYSTELFELASLEEHLVFFKQFQADFTGLNTQSIVENDGEFKLKVVDEEGNLQFYLIVTISQNDPTIIQNLEIEVQE